MTSIYCIHCGETGLNYVGQTKYPIEKRLKAHITNAKRPSVANQKFAKAILRFGGESFIVGLLEECDSEDANNRENYWINKLDSVDSGYNTMRRGISNAKGVVRSEEAKRKTSETMRQRRAQGLPVGCPKGQRPWNKKYETEEERKAARRKRLNPEGRQKKRGAGGRFITNK